MNDTNGTVQDQEQLEQRAWAEAHAQQIKELTPHWATKTETTQHPEIFWNRKVLDSKFFSADIYLTADLSDGDARWGQLIFPVTILHSEVIDFLSTAHMREAASSLLASANEIDNILAK